MQVSELAKRAGVSRGFVKDLEHNHFASPSLLHVLKVVQALGVPMSVILGERDRDEAEIRADDERFQAGYTAAVIDMQDAIYHLRRRSRHYPPGAASPAAPVEASPAE